MSKTDYAKCSNFLKIVFLIIFIHFCGSAPVSVTENGYSQFIAELNRNKCSVPYQVQLPFDKTKANNYEYLSSYLEICQKTELIKRNKEAVVLCKEIFGNIRNISCPTKTALPDINVKLSKNVCKDISALKDSVPEDKSLLKRLTDGFLCDIMCDNEFEKACQVLLWSFEVQKQIASVANAQEPEQPNVPEDGGNINDNFKQDNTVDEGNSLQINIDSDNEKKNAKEAKDLNEVIEPNGIIEASEPLNLKGNLEQKFDANSILVRNGKQEKLVSNNKEAVLGNQTLPKAEIPDITVASKSTNLETSITLSQQMSVVQTSNSDTEGKPMSETTKDESDVQNVNKKVQSNIANIPVTQHDKVNAGDGLSQGSDTNFAIDEQTLGINTNSFSNRVQDKKNTNMLSEGYLQDDSNIPANENVSLNGENIPNEMSQKGDQNSNFLMENEPPPELENAKKSNDVVADLHNNEQIPSNLVDTFARNKLQNTSSNDEKLAKKTDSPSTGSQTIQEATQNKTSISRDETKTNQPQINSGSKKGEIQDNFKTDAIASGLITDDGTRNALTDQKKTKVAQQTEEFDNTIPNSTGTSIAADEKQSEKSQKSQVTVINPDGKSVTPSSLTETSTKLAVALEKMEDGSDLHQPTDEETDHLEDLENTDVEEYSRPDYDGGLYEASKNKGSLPDVPSPITVSKEIITNQNDERLIEFPSRNSFGQDSSDIQMIAAFPEQEDSHFFFYFLSIVLILMAGYLIFHNKQKIIALIVEGRHERNRRSHRIGYKKLETK